ncbi:PH domain-containing protein [Puerhibacterium puerhi]|uniref:PH domain-containing protein n=1 Tax=Puerhibacterium puerhi TaxID=2692623 RepID=UPI001F2B07FF|nr:PH domain-containing protein [Puerhibacterium puerhi]
MSAADPTPHGAPPTGATGADAPAGDLAWQRMHPVTPFVRGWSVILVAIAFIGHQTLDQLEAVGGAAAAVSQVSGLWWKVALAVVLLLALVFGYAALAWRMTAYAVDDDAVHLRKGVLFRQQRHARLDRLQAVDIRQPLLARLGGLAELTLEVAGGSGSGVAIGFLREQDARRLRADLLARAAGVKARRTGTPAPAADAAAVRPDAGPATGAAAPVDGVPAADGVALVDGVPAAGVAGRASAGRPADGGLDEVDEAPEEQVYEVPAGRLVHSLLRSPALWVVALGLVGVVVAVALTRNFGILVSAAPAVLGGGGYLFQRFAGEFGFRAALSPDGIRLRHGLLETRAQTIPPGRVQAVSLTQGPLWRGPDWWRVKVNVAGYATGENTESQNVLLPVGPRAEALTALWLVLPDLGTEDPLRLLDEGLTGTDPHGQFTVAPRRSRWLDPVAWRRNGFAVTDRALLLRSGRVVRRLVLVPHERTQSLAVAQGPWQRRLAVATFTVHSTAGPVAPAVAHLDAGDAGRLLEEQARRARTARATAGPERWMEQRAQVAEANRADGEPAEAAAPGSAPGLPGGGEERG